MKTLRQSSGNLENQSDSADLTIVVATLGEHTLAALLKSISSSSLKPKFVYLIAPMGVYINEEIVKIYKRTLVLTSPEKSQVRQRLHGLRYVKTKIVVQLDSDVVLQPDTLFYLYSALISKGKFSVVSPITTEFVDTKKHLLLDLMSEKIKVVRNLVLDGKKNLTGNTITKAGVPVSELSKCLKNQVPIPGSWTNSLKMYYTDRMIDFDYYKFGGKAYFEDVIQSIEFNKRKMQLWIVPRAKVMHQSAEGNELLEFRSKAKILRWISLEYGFSRIRLEFYLCLRFLSIMAQKLFNAPLNRPH